MFIRRLLDKNAHLRSVMLAKSVFGMRLMRIVCILYCILLTNHCGCYHNISAFKGSKFIYSKFGICFKIYCLKYIFEISRRRETMMRIHRPCTTLSTYALQSSGDTNITSIFSLCKQTMETNIGDIWWQSAVCEYCDLRRWLFPIRFSINLRFCNSVFCFTKPTNIR